MAQARIKLGQETVRTPVGEGTPLARATPGRMAVRETLGEGLYGLGRGLDRLAAGLHQQDEENARAWAANALAQARLDWTTQLIERQSKVEPGAPEFTPTLLRDFDEYSNKLLETAPTETSRAFLEARLADFRADLGIRAITFEATARVDYRDDLHRSAVDNSAKLMNTDPSQYQVVLGELLAAIESSGVPPLKRSERREYAINTVSRAAVWSQIQKSPSAFLESIGFGAPADGKTTKSSGDLSGRTGNMAFDALPFDQRVQMFESAIRLKAQIDRDAEKAAIADRKQTADNAVKEGWSLFYSGKLTRDWIESMRPVLDSNDYRSLLKAHKDGLGGESGSQKSDPDAYRELAELEARGRYDEVVEMAFRYHRNGQLSNEHLTSFTGRARSLARSEGPRSQYERSRAYIRDSMDPGPYVKDPIGKTRLAEAMDTFDQWMISGKRTDEEIRTRAREIVSEFKFTTFSESVMTLKVPRGTMIRRSLDPKILLNDIRAAGETLRRNYNAGKLTPKEYDEESAVLNEWVRVLQELQRGQQ